MPSFRFDYYVQGHGTMAGETREQAQALFTESLRAANPGIEDLSVDPHVEDSVDLAAMNELQPDQEVAL